MHIRIRHTRADGLEHFGEFSGADPLTGRSDNICCGHGAGDGSATQRAFRCAGLRLRSVIAEEDHDPADDILLAKMDVRKQRVRGQIRISKFKRDGILAVDRGLEFSFCQCGVGGNLVEPFQEGVEPRTTVIILSVAYRRCRRLQ